MSEAKDLAAAIAVGRQSRTDLAHDLARAFRRDPGRFDPRSLERLGAAGLPQFLEAVGAPVMSSVPHASTLGQPSAVPSSRTAIRALGWSHLRRPERPIWIVGVAVGVRAGVFTVGAAAVAMLCVERLLPLVPGALS